MLEASSFSFDKNNSLKSDTKMPENLLLNDDVLLENMAPTDSKHMDSNGNSKNSNSTLSLLDQCILLAFWQVFFFN